MCGSDFKWIPWLTLWIMKRKKNVQETWTKHIYLWTMFYGDILSYKKKNNTNSVGIDEKQREYKNGCMNYEVNVNCGLLCLFLLLSVKSSFI